MVYPASPEENVTYTYDQTSRRNKGIGRLTQITDESGSTTYQYDHRGNLINKTTKLNDQRYTTTYQYDLGNNPTRMVYPSGLLVRYSYDSQGRVEKVITRQPDQAPETLVSRITYLPFGATTGMTYGNGLNSVMAYDQDYRLIALNTGSIVDMSYRYDANGNITVIDDRTTTNNRPAGNTESSYQYDVLDRLLNSTDNDGVLDYTYDPVGNRLSRAHHQDTDSQSETYNYLLGSNQLSNIDTNINGTSSQRKVTYDNNGNPTEINDTTRSDLNSTYNAANRLAQVITATATVDYTYNALGQRTQKIITKNSSTTTTHYLYNEVGQLVSKINDNGQTTRDYIYLNGQLIATSISTVSEVANDEFYLLDSDTGRRLRPANRRNGSPLINADAGDTSDWTRYRQVAGPDGYFYLQNVQTGMYLRPINRSDGSGLEQRPSSFRGKRTQWSINNDEGSHLLVSRWLDRQTEWRAVPVANAGMGIYYYHNDHLGTPKTITDENQQVVWEATYTPFGEANITTETITNNIRFPGQLYDSETGLHYNWWRYYDPQTGRYITSDHLGLFDGLNTYVYVHNNPLIGTDPTGEFNVVGAIAGAAVELGVQTLTQLAKNDFRFECVNIDIADVIIAGIGGGLFPGAGKVFTDVVFPGKVRKARSVLKEQLGRSRTKNRRNKIGRRIDRKNNALRDTVGGAIAGQVVTRTAKAISGKPSGGNCGCEN